MSRAHTFTCPNPVSYTHKLSYTHTNSLLDALPHFTYHTALNVFLLHVKFCDALYQKVTKKFKISSSQNTTQKSHKTDSGTPQIKRANHKSLILSTFFPLRLNFNHHQSVLKTLSCCEFCARFVQNQHHGLQQRVHTEWAWCERGLGEGVCPAGLQASICFTLVEINK